METPWRSWCRLCAQESGTISIFANNNDFNMSDLIKDILHFEIHPSDKAPVTICRTCVQFLSSVFKFIQHASKVQSMFSTMISDQKDTSGSNTKSQFGLVKVEPEWRVNDNDPPPIECSIGDYEFNHVAKKEEIEEMYDPQTDPLHMNSSCGGENYDLNPSTSLVVKKVPEEVSVDNKTDELSENTDDDDKEPYDPPVPVQPTKVESTQSLGKRKYKVKGPPFPCDSCDQVFMLRELLWKHRKSKHKKKIFSCKQCDKAFDTGYNLKRHETVHGELEEKHTYPCSICDKKFTTKHYVQIHLRTIHEGERPFVCEKCGQSFTNKSNLLEHNLTHLQDTPHKCTTCGKAFKCARALKRHEETHSETTYPCPICGLKLGRRMTLRRHMLLHSDVKKYECKFCNSKFKQSKTLKVHLLTHTGLQPYACQFCDRTFVNGSNCRSHKKKVHPVELAMMEASGEVAQPTRLPKLKQLMETNMPRN